MNTAPSIIVPTDISLKIREIETAYMGYLAQHRIPDDHIIIVNYSGGKDSTTTLGIAHHLFGDKVRSVMADTDNEHELTIDFAKNIHNQIGCTPVEVVKRIYTHEHFDRRRATITKGWSKKQAIRMGAYRGVIMPSLNRCDTQFGRAWQKTAERWGIEFDTPLEAALSVLQPSGNSFLDAALLHGKFPMLRDRFCTDELKIQIAYDAVMAPLLNDGEVIVQWSGVRADESSKRAGYSRFEVDQREPDYLYNFLPIHQWTAMDVFALHKYFGIKPNPLYLKGADRVGCMNCVLCNKEEIAQTAARWPDDSPYPATISGGCWLAQAWADGYNVRNAVTAAPAGPEGYKLMPIDMTDGIGEAIAIEANCCGGIALDIYNAALAAAPTPTK